MIHAITHAQSTSRSRYLVLQVSLDTTGHTAMAESQSERVWERTRWTCKQALWRNICLAFLHKTQEPFLTSDRAERQGVVRSGFLFCPRVKLFLLFYQINVIQEDPACWKREDKSRNRDQVNPFSMPPGTTSIHSTESLHKILLWTTELYFLLRAPGSQYRISEILSFRSDVIQQCVFHTEHTSWTETRSRKFLCASG